MSLFVPTCRSSRYLQAIPFARRSYSTKFQNVKRWPFGLLFLSGGGLLASVYYANPFEAKVLPLSPDYFTPLKLLRKEKLNDHTSLFVLEVPPALRPHQNDGKAIKSVHVMQPELSIQRAYTPLSVAGFANGELELVVKRYADGEMSRYMHRQQVGDEIKVRGPVQTWLLDPTLEHIVFVSFLILLKKLC